MTKKTFYNGGTLNSYEKGESGNPKGRPRKIASQLKHAGYKREEVQTTVEKMLSMHQDELDKFSRSKDITVVERGILKMIDNFFKKGKTELLDYILPKAQVKEEPISTTNINVTMPSDPTEASKMYQELMK